MSFPLVSCIMPTLNRRLFVAKAIEYFRRQTWPNRELVIVRDESDTTEWPVAISQDLVFLSAPKMTLGAKRNFCVEHSRGDFIAHWDDDDWYGPDRITQQVTAMQAARGEVCGVERPLFLDLASGESYRFRPGRRPYLYCATLMYTREFWQRIGFPDMQTGSGIPFIWPASDLRRLDRAVVLDSSSWYVGLAHSGNTSPKDFRRVRFEPAASVQAAMGADWAFYEGCFEKG